MRIRYGKPIKLKSLLGTMNNFSNIGGTGANTYIIGKNGYFYGLPGSFPSAGRLGISLESSHTYMVINKNDDVTHQLNSTANTPQHYVVAGTNANSIGNYNASNISYFDNNTLVIGTFTGLEIFDAWYYFNFTTSWYWNSDIKPIYLILIDLTEIGLDNLTAQEFYNKYNKYFPLIATGEEITIDDKAGQIAYKNLEEESIRCKIAGGSSDIYYGYNQKINPFNTGANECSRTYDDVNNEFTLTATSSTINSYFGLSCIKLTGMAGHKVLFMGNVTEVSTAAPFNNITGEWAMINITDRQRATGVGLTYCIGEWRDVTSNYVNITTSTGFTVGDYFKIKDVQTIDLTDWFGSGKEPSTYEEFKEKFTKEYYGFCPIPIKLTRYQIEALPNYGYNQLCEHGNFDVSTGWGSSNGSIVISNNILTYTATSNATSYYSNKIYRYISGQIVGHKYLQLAEAKTSTNLTLNVQVREATRNEISCTANTWTQIWQLANLTEDTGNYAFRLNFGSTMTSGNTVQVRNMMLIDLTDWYGPGNEPTTVEEFKATFPNLYYPYSQKRLLNKYMINKLQA